MDYAGLKRPYPLDRERKRRVMVELARRGLTISELAARIGDSQGNVSSCIAGKRLCRPLEERIASYLKLPAEYLFPVRTGKQLLAMKQAEEEGKAERAVVA